MEAGACEIAEAPGLNVLSPDLSREIGCGAQLDHRLVELFFDPESQADPAPNFSREDRLVFSRVCGEDLAGELDIPGRIVLRREASKLCKAVISR